MGGRVRAERGPPREVCRGLRQNQLHEGVEIPLARQTYADGSELFELGACLEGFEPHARVLARLTEHRGERTRGNRGVQIGVVQLTPGGVGCSIID